jgi:amino acid adenylation domain-containing protein
MSHPVLLPNGACVSMQRATQVRQDEAQDVPGLVGAQASTTPEQVALTAGAEKLSFRELDCNSDQIARLLSALGVGPGVAVGVCMDRSVAAVLASLAILKAGGAYVPIDLAGPRERIDFTLRDARVPIVLTVKCGATLIPVGPWRVVALDQDWPEIDEHRPPLSPAGLDDLAYIIYTSGSTGRPKGVEITRRSLLNLIRWHQQTFQITNRDRASQVASFAFDAAVWEIWPHLASGASVHIADEEIRKDPRRLRDWLLRQEISVAFVPTGLAERMLHLDWPMNTQLRVLLTGGDTLRLYPSANLPFTLVNNYGPTESTVVATSGPVLPSDNTGGLPSIGCPVLNTDIYILDEHLQEVTKGSMGEIYIGGAGLARGYCNRPDLTAEKFVANPFAHGSRLYRTGDLARYLPDGRFAFSGRVDEQTKVRGQRVELNEVTVALNRHEGVQESVVVTREGVDGEKNLVAYIVPRPDFSPTDGSLRDFLATLLPDYMIPALFVSLPSIPLGPTGKIDRRSLPEPTSENTLRDEVFVAPRTPVEERLINMLRPLLGVEQVGINDNFFLIGGHSLLGAEFLARVRDSFGVELSLLGLFDHPTVADISLEVERLIMNKLQSMSEVEIHQMLAATGPNPHAT